MRVRAAILSLLIPGLGQVYLDHLGRAVIWFAGLVGVAVAARGATPGWQTALLAGALGVASAIDAALIGDRRVR